MISLISLNKSYGNNHVLKDVNLNFTPGRIYGFLGDNGAGKTTLFRCIAGLEQYEGEITSNLKPLRNYLGFLPTEPWFFSKITGREYITLVCNARHKKITDIEDKNIFNLPLNQYASTYSTGLKKKLALTALLVQENEYFILDEPFNGIDIQSNIILTEIILRLKQLNKIILLSSHIFSTLSDTCDEIHHLIKAQPIRTIEKPDFTALEQEMKSAILNSSIDKLGLK